MTPQSLVERVQNDAAFAGELVTDYLKLKEEKRAISAELDDTKQMKNEAQLALRQARGFSVYLKGKQGSIDKVELERKNSLRNFEEQTVILKITNKELRERLDEAKRIEQEAKLAARQAKGFAKYLKTKSAGLEKQLDAAKAEHETKLALQQARVNKATLKDTMKDNDFTCSEHSSDAFVSDFSVSSGGTFDLNELEEFAIEQSDDNAEVPEELTIEMAGQ